MVIGYYGISKREIERSDRVKFTDPIEYHVNISAYYSRLVSILCLFIGVYIVIPNYISIALGPIQLSLDRILFVILITFWSFGIFFLKTVRRYLFKRLRSNKLIVFLIILFLILQWISVFNSVDFDTSLKRYLYYFFYISICFMCILSIPFEDVYMDKIAKTFFYCTALIILIAGLELAINSNPFTTILGIRPSNEFQEQVLLEKIRAGGRRIQSSFSNPLSFGQYLILIVPILLFFKGKYLYKKRFLIYLLTILIYIISFQIKSRAIFLIFGASIVYGGYNLIFLQKARLSLKILAILSLSLALTIIISATDLSVVIDNMFEGKEMLSDDNRMNQIAAAGPLIANNFFFGVGFGKGAEVLGYGDLDGSATIDNYFLTLVLDSGFIALIIFTLLIVVILFKYFKIRDEEKLLWLGLVLFIINLFSLSLKEVHPLFYFFLALFLIHSKENEGLLSNNPG